MVKRAPEGWHPASRFAVLGGVRCHYVDTVASAPPGAPTLLLLHGIAVSSWAWRFNVDALARDFRVIAPCHQGFGWSERPKGDYSVGGLARFVLALLDRVDVGRAHVCGNSLGGAIALWLAQHRPARVDRLVLENPAALATQRPWTLLHTQIPALVPAYRALVGPTVLRAGLMALAYKNLQVDSGYMAGFMAPWRERGSLRTLLAVARSLPASLAAIDLGLELVRAPTLVLWGRRDGLLPARDGYTLAKRLPAARLVFFEASGHCPHEEEPARFNDAVARFLGAAPDAPAAPTAKG